MMIQMTSHSNIKYDKYGELMTTVQVCEVLFGKSTVNNKRNLYNYIKSGKFPKPRIKGKNYFLFSNKEVYQFVRHGVMDDNNSVGD